METSKEAPNNNHRRKMAAVVIFVFVAALGLISIFFYVAYKGTHITTDDAFVEGSIHVIAPKIPGTVRGVHVRDNQFVRKGDILLELDPADYEVKVKEAAAAVNSERGRLAEIDSRIEASRRQLAELQAKAEANRALLELQKANLEQARTDISRAEVLYKKEALSRERYERASTAYKVALAQVAAAEEGLKTALHGVETQKAVIRQVESARAVQSSEVKRREAQLGEAELKFGYSKIAAPADGHVTRKTVETGNQVQPGQPLMAIVPLEGLYVVANYKETQLDKIRAGQRVKIRVDSYPGRTFEGRVDSIMAGTGSIFSLFPPENATGNYVKVVQRVPVKIVIEKGPDSGHVLRVGMSVVPTVIVEK